MLGAYKYSPITPLAFTEQGVAMLSGILRSPIAIKVNIAIMRAFVNQMNQIYDGLIGISPDPLEYRLIGISFDFSHLTTITIPS